MICIQNCTIWILDDIKYEKLQKVNQMSLGVCDLISWIKSSFFPCLWISQDFFFFVHTRRLEINENVENILWKRQLINIQMLLQKHVASSHGLCTHILLSSTKFICSMNRILLSLRIEKSSSYLSKTSTMRG